jgi:predicted phage terminase large subunit-like protein
MGKMKDGRWIILDVITGRWGAVERERIIKATAIADRARFKFPIEVWVEQEPGSGGKESAEATVRNLAGFTCKIERVTGAKELRADPFASQASVGNVIMLEAPWNAQCVDELEIFPAGKLKDICDSLSGAFNKMFSPVDLPPVDPSRLTETKVPGDELGLRSSPDELGLGNESPI